MMDLASTYYTVGRLEEALSMERDVYSGSLSLFGEEHKYTLLAANNYANTLLELKGLEEAKTLTRKTIPLARRILGEGATLTLRTRWNYARALYEDPAATLDDLREAVTTLEEIERTARRVLGRAHPLTESMEGGLRDARVVLRRRVTT